MKRTFLFLMSVILLTAFSSCEKEVEGTRNYFQQCQYKGGSSFFNSESAEEEKIYMDLMLETDEYASDNSKEIVVDFKGANDEEALKNADEQAIAIFNESVEGLKEIIRKYEEKLSGHTKGSFDASWTFTIQRDIELKSETISIVYPAK